MDASLFDKYKKQKSNETERGLLLTEFVSIINEERKGTKFKPTTIKLLAIKLAHIPTNDLYYMKSICTDSKNRHGSFGKCLFGSIKPKV
jgi:hypothetical protein